MQKTSIQITDGGIGDDDLGIKPVGVITGKSGNAERTLSFGAFNEILKSKYENILPISYMEVSKILDRLGKPGTGEEGDEAAGIRQQLMRRINMCQTEAPGSPSRVFRNIWQSTHPRLFRRIEEYPKINTNDLIKSRPWNQCAEPDAVAKSVTKFGQKYNERIKELETEITDYTKQINAGETLHPDSLPKDKKEKFTLRGKQMAYLGISAKDLKGKHSEVGKLGFQVAGKVEEFQARKSALETKKNDMEDDTLKTNCLKDFMKRLKFTQEAIDDKGNNLPPCPVCSQWIDPKNLKIDLNALKL